MQDGARVKIFWEFVKDVGWIAAVGALLIVAGAALGFGIPIKDYLDFNSQEWTPHRIVAVVLSAVGLLMILGTIVTTHVNPRRVKEISERSVMEVRRAVYFDAVRTIKRHQALSRNDDPKFVSRVIKSAHTFEAQMNEMQQPTLDNDTKDFLAFAGRLAKEFYLSVEHMEYVLKLNLTQEDIRMDQLSNEYFDDFANKRERWVDRTESLFQGAAKMLGTEPPNFYF
jgi:hypothetical protein